jgi:hypothetical protein
MAPYVLEHLNILLESDFFKRLFSLMKSVLSVYGFGGADRTRTGMVRICNALRSLSATAPFDKVLIYNCLDQAPQDNFLVISN